MRILLAIVAVSLGVTACTPPRDAPDAPDAPETTTLPETTPPPGPQLSLIGTPLREPDFSDETRARLEKDLEIAKAVFRVAPEREDSYIWLGRRLGYLARFPEAVDVFTEGLEAFPDSYKLLRFRGRHRARNRQLELAVEDYRRAAELVEPFQDSFEPDGIINARHQYLGTYKSNIHYYLGQTSYALGDYEQTLAGMERAMREPLGQSPDRLVSTAYWRYLAHRKLGQHDEARQVVEEVPIDLEMVENFTYYQSVLFFRGDRSRDDVLSEADVIQRFAVAMEDHFDGDDAAAVAQWRRLVEDTAQGFWPAEAELIFAGAADPR